MNTVTHPFIRIAGICAVLAPLMMLAADLLLLVSGRKFDWTIGLFLAFVLFVPAIFGITYFGFGSGNKLALIGGALAFFGVMAGASMQVLFRVYAVLEEIGAVEALESLQKTFKLIASTQMIGLTFPIGLILLASSLFRSRIFHSVIPILLATGAILFPVGRIGGFTLAVMSSDLVLLSAFGLIGWHILKRSENMALMSEANLATVN